MQSFPPALPPFLSRLAARLPSRLGAGLRSRLAAGLGGRLERLAWFGAGLSAGSAAWLVGEMALRPLAAQPSLPPRPTLVPLRVQVAGAVEQPGVYEVASGARVEDALRAAGGLSPAADPSGVNLVARVADGQRIAVPARPALASPRPTRTPGARRTPTPLPAAARPPPSRTPGAAGPHRALASPW